MLIALSKDKHAARGFDVLKKMYPLEVVGTYPNILIAGGKIILEPNKSLPTRISFLGHSDESGIFGDVTADEFASVLVDQLRQAAKINPSIKTSIQAIDLVGCSCGLVDKNGKSVADTVAQHLEALKAEGFGAIRINALTNLTMANPFPMVELSVLPLSGNSYVCYGFRSDDIYKKWKKGIKETKTLENEKSTLQDQVEGFIEHKKGLLAERKDTSNLEKFLKAKEAAEQSKKILLDKLRILETEFSAMAEKNKSIELMKKNMQREFEAAPASRRDQLKVDAAKIMATQKELFDNGTKLKEEIEKVNAELEQKEIQLAKAQAEYEKALKATKDNEVERDKWIQQIDGAINKLTLLITEKTTEITQKTTEIDSYPLIVAHTKDIRKTLDENPRNNFANRGPSKALQVTAQAALSPPAAKKESPRQALSFYQPVADRPGATNTQRTPSNDPVFNPNKSSTQVKK